MRTILISIILLASHWLAAQLQVEVNGLLDLSLSKASEGSSFFYNGVNHDYTDLRFGPSEANLITLIHFGECWQLNTRLRYARDEGGAFDKADIPLFNLEWKSESGRWRWQLGRFLNPFGRFNEQQLSTDRTFIGLPVTHQYSTRISNVFGGLYFADRPPVSLAARPRGWPLHYYGGYQTGLRGDWIIEPDRLMLAAALTSGSALAPDQLQAPLKLGINARLQWQPSYWWQQGFSLSVGHIMKRDPRNAALPELGQYRQLLVGTDIQIGLGFWEISGELMAGRQRVPLFSPADQAFMQADDSLLTANIFSAAGYGQVRFEPPFLTGGYIGYRLGGILFGDHPLPDQSTRWDYNAIQQEFAIGYQITRWLLLRTGASWLHVQAVEENLWRGEAMLTVHF